ncbi:MAG TPA: hypothetical protein VHA56_02200 [Mucilaginibacter sp.]|nr:hypothetical protein [Mucilaginibacter sp.]
MKTALLFVIFNRPETTTLVFNQIRKAKPPRLYVAADGPRAEKAGESDLCFITREIINNIDWECEVKTLFRDENLGCKQAVSSAVTWFFENEEEGIILEDDCLPADSFFSFCETLLEKYRYDTRIRHITGCNLQMGKKWGTGSYYFSNMTHVWGWAGWRRVWQDYDKDLNRYNATEIPERMKNIFGDEWIAKTLAEVFNEVKNGKIDTWDYQLDFANYFNNGLTIIPNENLISNIGFGAAATHTIDGTSIYANMPLGELSEIVHPLYVMPEKQADLSVLMRDFRIEKRKRKHNKLSRRFKRWFKSKLMSVGNIIKKDRPGDVRWTVPLS